ncbi:unnamed protein product [Mesocestoides corti]|uniref:Cadherin domain-containing protein n=1 Tax=Mesocestoides corti TaxID=53468 RepID=A0A0R3U619_MESCO|nr:unnamed protein product [Mesocestoides corti]
MTQRASPKAPDPQTPKRAVGGSVGEVEGFAEPLRGKRTHTTPTTTPRPTAKHVVAFCVSWHLGQWCSGYRACPGSKPMAISHQRVLCQILRRVCSIASPNVLSYAPLIVVLPVCINMIGRSVHHLLIFILPLLTSAEHGTNQRTASFEMQEETELNTTIGSLRENLSPYPGSKVAFMYSGDFFRIDCHTGEVKVAVVLDRETVCQEHKICCGVIDCTLVDKVYLVYAESRDYIATILLKVDLTDINDNRPVFGSHLQRVNILENSEVGRYIGLRSATDADVNPKNQVNRYQWIEPTGTFILDQNNLPSIRLRLNSPVDREMRANYSGTLSACDIDSCTTTDVFIEVEDVNDNSPQFYKRHYRLESPESLTVGSTILRLNATDADSGDNAKIVYSFREPVDPDLADTFEIIANSGELRLRRPLDAKIRSSYNFKVVACDSVASECAGNDASSADIEVVVKDVNDNRPVIEIIPAGDYTSSTGDLVVQENFPAGQIAVVKVKDADIGENSRTACELDDHTSPSVFDLSQSAPDLYFLRTMRSFDFEQESVLTTTIRCRDFGTPPLSSVRTLTLRVLDVNEYAPEFHQRVFSTSVRENSQPGVDIITLSAIDRDGQSELRYKLAPPPLQHAEGEDIYSTAVSPSSTNSVETMGVNVHFDLDPKTGVLRTSRMVHRHSLIKTTATGVAKFAVHVGKSTAE